MAIPPATATDDPVGSVRSRRAPMALFTWVVVLLVLVIVAGLLLFKVTRTNQNDNGRPKAMPAPGAVVQAAATVPAAVFNTVGASAAGVPVPVVLSGQPPLTSQGRTEVVYVGSEFCPYCAAVRWSLVVALSRFGTFSHLGQTRSSSSEAFPGLQSFSFDGAGYRSRDVAWSGVEEYGPTLDTAVPVGYRMLHQPGPEALTLMARYGPDDAAAWAGGSATLPFVDIGNRVLVEGAGIGFSPGVIQGLSLSQIASDLSEPTSPVAEAIIGGANEITAGICAGTDQLPARVCRSAGVRAGAGRLGL
jgi:hypothetical protein